MKDREEPRPAAQRAEALLLVNGLPHQQPPAVQQVLQIVGGQVVVYHRPAGGELYQGRRHALTGGQGGAQLPRTGGAVVFCRAEAAAGIGYRKGLV